jgi:uncharacterized protein involved in exopolysaccharide biosynthesis
MWSMIVGVVASTVIAFVLTPKFQSSTTVLPADRAELFGALDGVSNLMKSFSPRSLASLGSNPEIDRYLAILKSGRVVSAVITKFDLVRVYDITSYPGEKASEELLSNTRVEAEPEGCVTVTVWDADPQRAADMANYFVMMLNTVNGELLVANARANREFIGERYAKNLNDLAQAEDSLKSFQKRHGVIAMPQQTEESLKAGAQLAAQLAMREVDLAIQKRSQSLESPGVLAAQIEVDELRKKITDMNRGHSGSTGDMKVFVPFNAIPDLGAEYMRRYREVEIQYKILQLMTPLYEQAKIEERRQTPSVLVLDKAAPAERKSKPKRALIILGGLVLSLVFALGYTTYADWWHRAGEAKTETYVSISGLLDGLKDDWRSIRKRFS